MRRRIPTLIMLTLSVAVVVALIASALSSGVATSTDTVRGSAVLGPACRNGGVTIHQRDAANWTPALATTSDGHVIVADQSEGRSGVGPSIHLWAVNASCTPDQAFGSHGTVVVHLPKSPGVAGFSNGAYVASIASTRDGRILLAGSVGDEWFVGELTARGQLVSKFGVRGFSTLVPRGFRATTGIPPYVAAMTVGAGGRIFVGGSAGQPHAGLVDELYALTPEGRVDTSFGSRGVTTVLSVPQSEGVGTDMTALIARTDGSVMAVGWLGGAGCGSERIDVVSSSGRPESSLNRSLVRSLALLPAFNIAASLGFPDGSVDLYGSSGLDCSSSAPLAPSGFVLRLRPDGTATGPLVTVTSPNPYVIFAAPLTSGGVVSASIHSPRVVLVRLVRWRGRGGPLTQSSARVTLRTSALASSGWSQVITARGANNVWLVVAQDNGVHVMILHVG